MEKIKFYELSNYTTQARATKSRIFLHWSAGDYETVYSDYHVNITGKGKIYIDGSLADVRYHTWHRNTPSIGISVCCMGGDTCVLANGYISKWGDYPPTPRQIVVMGRVVAKICVEVGIPLEKVMTHGEIAEVDGYGVKNQSNAGGVIRWDLLGYGDKIRKVAGKFIEKWKNRQKRTKKAQ